MSHILGAAPTGGHTRPPPNSADADDARPLGASATHWQFLASCHSAGYGRPSAHDARRLASLGVVHGGPETRHCPGNGCETRVRVPRSLRARSRTAQWKNEGTLNSWTRLACGVSTVVSKLAPCCWWVASRYDAQSRETQRSRQLSAEPAGSPQRLNS